MSNQSPEMPTVIVLKQAYPVIDAALFEYLDELIEIQRIRGGIIHRVPLTSGSCHYLLYLKRYADHAESEGIDLGRFTVRAIGPELTRIQVEASLTTKDSSNIKALLSQLLLTFALYVHTDVIDSQDIADIEYEFRPPPGATPGTIRPEDFNTLFHQVKDPSPGRPPVDDYDWAWQEIANGKDQETVFRIWLKTQKNMDLNDEREMRGARERFRKAMERRERRTKRT